MKGVKANTGLNDIEPKCKQCGKCCHSMSATMTIADMNREPRLWEVAIPIQKVGNLRTRTYMAEKKHPFAINKLHRGAACPFLAKTNECIIHSTRPQICRDYPHGKKCMRELQECLR